MEIGTVGREDIVHLGQRHTGGRIGGRYREDAWRALIDGNRGKSSIAWGSCIEDEGAPQSAESAQWRQGAYGDTPEG